MEKNWSLMGALAAIALAAMACSETSVTTTTDVDGDIVETVEDDTDVVEDDSDSSQCTDGEMGCIGSKILVVCIKHKFERTTCPQGKTCDDGACITTDGDVDDDSEIENDTDVVDEDTVDHDSDGDTDSETDSESETVEDGDSVEVDSDSESEAEDDTDSEVDSESETTEDGDTVEIDTEAEIESETEADSESETEITPECTSGPCCENGKWLAVGSPCLSGQDSFECTVDSCDEFHECIYDMSGYCIIDDACIADGTINITNACTKCDASVPTAWTAVENNTPCATSDPCIIGACHSGYCFPNANICVDGDNDSESEVEDGDVEFEVDSESEATEDGDEVEVDTETEVELESETEVDSESETEIVPECTDGPCCSNGKWLTPGSSCPGEIACVDYTCGTNHTCGIAGVKTGKCYIGQGACYNNGDVDPNNACQLCDNADKYSWTPAPAGTTCSDNNKCTENDSCQLGGCIPGTPKNCSDGNIYTTDTCIQETGGCTRQVVCNGTQILLPNGYFVMFIIDEQLNSRQEYAWSVGTTGWIARDHACVVSFQDINGYTVAPAGCNGVENQSCDSAFGGGPYNDVCVPFTEECHT